ncbi:ethanolamine ammonia-lyase subunit EutC [Cryptosporangium aurantiacum]|uniref:Ethanolamine ammonia-lyase small subunit n=1 Tax=Cryptosporangium aurantiacum TaxID=134849 RepID=A0A1M7RP12_9ACTN|nr:ethanolamine ammonia-lyase subunit EutC [Cryptosporangium aurantiacum]SHN47941.1 Ethanolamine ammonia-lyase light chain [Cryptosporangium aurantiacum]
MAPVPAERETAPPAVPAAPAPATPDSARLASLRQHARTATPARLFLGGPGTSYPTDALLRLRLDHALAKDALRAEVGPEHPALRGIAAAHGLITVSSRATSHREYLLRPDLGRRLDDAGAATVARDAGQDTDLQLILGDGLSPEALTEHGPAVFAGLHAAATARGWSLGTPIYVHRARVGVLNDIGELTGCRVAVLLIGERPGLQTPRSLSAYMGFRPRHRHTNAERNLICNIQPDGVRVDAAVARIAGLLDDLVAAGSSGVAIKESVTPPALSAP